MGKSPKPNRHCAPTRRIRRPLLEHRDAQRRVATKEFARGPKSGEAAADNRHVNVEVLP